MDRVLFESWESIVRVVCIIPLAYFAMVVFLGVSGKRTLSKMNAFDFIVTIALGSILANVALNDNVPLANGVVAMLLFIVLQFLLTWLSVRVKPVKTLITSNPSLVFYNGQFLDQAMKKERLTPEEIYSAARQRGYSSLDNVAMIILETTGGIAILDRMPVGGHTTIGDVKTTFLPEESQPTPPGS